MLHKDIFLLTLCIQVYTGNTAKTKKTKRTISFEKVSKN